MRRGLPVLLCVAAALAGCGDGDDKVVGFDQKFDTYYELPQAEVDRLGAACGERLEDAGADMGNPGYDDRSLGARMYSEMNEDETITVDQACDQVVATETGQGDPAASPDEDSDSGGLPGWVIAWIIAVVLTWTLFIAGVIWAARREKAPPFALQRQVRKIPEDLSPELLSRLTEPVGNLGYEVTQQSAAGITFHRGRRAGRWVLIVLLFPLGLLLLLPRRPGTITLSFREAAGLTDIVVTGPANHRRARDCIQSSLDSLDQQSAEIAGDPVSNRP